MQFSGSTSVKPTRHLEVLVTAQFLQQQIHAVKTIHMSDPLEVDCVMEFQCIRNKSHSVEKGKKMRLDLQIKEVKKATYANVMFAITLCEFETQKVELTILDTATWTNTLLEDFFISRQGSLIHEEMGRGEFFFL